ncbi:TetR family transcriptional regulator [Nocardioides plantarum]|uniref:TetR family transcriptional regulator n=1 Tax=Nocardioides plantarum TaxID=29299 RepID=A0ABV5KHB4_9ACTN|nr:TetR family transcriptional regulator [Nocardioides plantarum]
MAELKDVGGAIRARRQEVGLSLRALAGRLGVSPATLSAVENGRTPLTVTRLHRIAELLDTTAPDLLSGPAGSSGSAAIPQVPASRGATPEGRRGAWRDFSTISIDPVLEAAARVFVRQGFHATSMREVATEAHLSVAGVYHHHPSKERLLVSLLDLTLAEIGWRVEAARVEGRDPVDSFARMVESLALFHAVRADLAFIGASEMRALGPQERTRITGLRDGVQHALDTQAAACLDVGAFEVDDARTTLRAIATMCTSLPSWFRPEGPLDAASVARAYAQYALTLMGHREAPTPSPPVPAPDSSLEADSE